MGNPLKKAVEWLADTLEEKVEDLHKRLREVEEGESNG